MQNVKAVLDQILILSLRPQFDGLSLTYPHLLFFHVDAVLALIVVPAISFGIRAFGKYLRDLSHKTQAAAALAGSIAEVLPSEVSPTV